MKRLLKVSMVSLSVAFLLMCSTIAVSAANAGQQKDQKRNVSGGNSATEREGPRVQRVSASGTRQNGAIAVPEPAVIALLGAGLVSLGVYAKKKRKQG